MYNSSCNKGPVGTVKAVFILQYKGVKSVAIMRIRSLEVINQLKKKKVLLKKSFSVFQRILYLFQPYLPKNKWQKNLLVNIDKNLTAKCISEYWVKYEKLIEKWK